MEQTRESKIARSLNNFLVSSNLLLLPPTWTEYRSEKRDKNNFSEQQQQQACSMRVAWRQWNFAASAVIFFFMNEVQVLCNKRPVIGEDKRWLKCFHDMPIVEEW